MSSYILYLYCSFPNTTHLWLKYTSHYDHVHYSNQYISKWKSILLLSFFSQDNITNPKGNQDLPNFIQHTWVLVTHEKVMVWRLEGTGRQWITAIWQWSHLCFLCWFKNPLCSIFDQLDSTVCSLVKVWRSKTKTFVISYFTHAIMIWG